MRKFLSKSSREVFLCEKRISEPHARQIFLPEIKPVHITIDVNVKVDKALDDYFSDLDKTTAEQ